MGVAEVVIVVAVEAVISDFSYPAAPRAQTQPRDSHEALESSSSDFALLKGLAHDAQQRENISATQSAGVAQYKHQPYRVFSSD